MSQLSTSTSETFGGSPTFGGGSPSGMAGGMGGGSDGLGIGSGSAGCGWGSLLMSPGVPGSQRLQTLQRRGASELRPAWPSDEMDLVVDGHDTVTP